MNRQNCLLLRLLREHARDVQQCHIVGRLRALLCACIQGQASSADEVAQLMGLTRRTLSRRLEAEGTTFQRELDWTSYSMARHLLREPTIQVAEVAAVLAYSSSAAFIHPCVHTVVGRDANSMAASASPFTSAQTKVMIEPFPLTRGLCYKGANGRGELAMREAAQAVLAG
jgi:AraC-like DNA-binding protein